MFFIYTFLFFFFFFFKKIYYMFFFFFFQAEDGIRDGRVTGVQTCALPISTRRSRPRASRLWRRSVGSARPFRAPRSRRSSSRSEERRVGKECRSRWSP